MEQKLSSNMILGKKKIYSPKNVIGVISGSYICIFEELISFFHDSLAPRISISALKETSSWKKFRVNIDGVVRKDNAKRT